MEDDRKMQDFNEMLAQTAEKIERGMVIKGTVVGIRRDEVFVDIGMLHTSLIAAIQCFNEDLKRNSEKLTNANAKLKSVIMRHELA